MNMCVKYIFMKYFFIRKSVIKKPIDNIFFSFLIQFSSFFISI